MASEKIIVNFDDKNQKAMAMEWVRQMRGYAEMCIKPKRPNRTLAQNAYYHVSVVAAFRQGLSETQGCKLTMEEAHSFIKMKFLRVPVGDLGDTVRSTAKLDIEDFSELIESCIEFAGVYFGIEIQRPPEKWPDASIETAQDEPENKGAGEVGETLPAPQETQ